MPAPRILTLTTDFGTDGPYVAAMKGVVLQRVPDVRFVDVSHGIAPQNILEGAYVLASIVDVFPAGTVHLAVVDPGVGTERRLLAVLTAGHWFVLPDNGLISGVVHDRPPEAIYEIANPALRREVVSSTFHGRDILAPAAAHLLAGSAPADLGPARDEVVLLECFRPAREADGFLGEVLFRDPFGNLVTNIRTADLKGPPSGWIVEIDGRRIVGLSRTYGDHPTGTLIALPGSGPWIEVAVVNGDASRTLGAGQGSTVRCRRP